MAFGDLTISGDYSYYYIVEEEQETKLLNDTVWVKNRNDIWRGRLM